MPSITHEGPLDLVRQHPEIAVELVQGTAGIHLPGEVAVSLAPTGAPSDAARQHLEAMMTTSEHDKTLAERIHEQGISEGKAEGKAEDVLKLIDARQLGPSAEQRHRVTSCTEPAQLDLWFDRALTARTAAEVFTS
jgi:hypothetical protein